MNHHANQPYASPRSQLTPAQRKLYRRVRAEAAELGMDPLDALAIIRADCRDRVAVDELLDQSEYVDSLRQAA